MNKHDEKRFCFVVTPPVFCSVSVFQTVTFGCSSTGMEPLRSAASGWETGGTASLPACHFLYFSCTLGQKKDRILLKFLSVWTFPSVFWSMTQNKWKIPQLFLNKTKLKTKECNLLVLTRLSGSSQGLRWRLRAGGHREPLSGAAEERGGAKCPPGFPASLL